MAATMGNQGCRVKGLRAASAERGNPHVPVSFEGSTDTLIRTLRFCALTAAGSSRSHFGKKIHNAT